MVLWWFRSPSSFRRAKAQGSGTGLALDLRRAEYAHGATAEPSQSTVSPEVSARWRSSHSDADSRWVGTRIDPAELLESRLLGRGAFGEVSLATFRGTPVAVKRLCHNRLLSEQHLTSFRDEFSLLLTLRHPNIVLLLGGSIDEDGPSPRLTIVMEFCAHGSLGRVLPQTAAYPLPWVTHRLPIAIGIARALAFLHGQGVVHRDVKPDNVLLDGAFAPKLCDFGTSRVVLVPRASASATGTPLYCAPEVLRREASADPVDVWSFGCLLYCLETRNLPYPSIPPSAAIKRVANHQLRPELPEAAVLHAPLRLTTAFDAAQRASASHVLRELSSTHVRRRAVAADACAAEVGPAAAAAEAPIDGIGGAAGGNRPTVPPAPPGASAAAAAPVGSYPGSRCASPPPLRIRAPPSPHSPPHSPPLHRSASPPPPLNDHPSSSPSPHRSTSTPALRPAAASAAAASPLQRPTPSTPPPPRFLPVSAPPPSPRSPHSAPPRRPLPWQPQPQPSQPSQPSQPQPQPQQQPPRRHLVYRLTHPGGAHGGGGGGRGVGGARSGDKPRAHASAIHRQLPMFVPKKASAAAAEKASAAAAVKAAAGERRGGASSVQQHACEGPAMAHRDAGSSSGSPRAHPDRDRDDPISIHVRV